MSGEEEVIHIFNGSLTKKKFKKIMKQDKPIIVKWILFQEILILLCLICFMILPTMIFFPSENNGIQINNKYIVIICFSIPALVFIICMILIPIIMKMRLKYSYKASKWTKIYAYNNYFKIKIRPTGFIRFFYYIKNYDSPPYRYKNVKKLKRFEPPITWRTYYQKPIYYKFHLSEFTKFNIAYLYIGHGDELYKVIFKNPIIHKSSFNRSFKLSSIVIDIDNINKFVKIIESGKKQKLKS